MRSDSSLLSTSAQHAQVAHGLHKFHHGVALANYIPQRLHKSMIWVLWIVLGLVVFLVTLGDWVMGSAFMDPWTMESEVVMNARNSGRITSGLPHIRLYAGN